MTIDLSVLARAAGYIFVTYTIYDEDDCVYNTRNWIREDNIPDGKLILWNPMKSNGDALALAIDVSRRMIDGNSLRIFFGDSNDETVVVKDYNGIHVRRGGMFAGNIHEETRRAICQAVMEYATINNI